MADRKIRNITSDYLTCSICWNTYNDPKMLQCGHSYCSKCLYDYVCVIYQKRNCFECPECRHPQDIKSGSTPEDVIKSLRNDTVSVSILKALGLQNDFEVEDNSDMKILTDIESVDAENNQETGVALSACARHREKPLDVYCSKHEIAICALCASVNHSGPECECTPVKVVISKRQNALKCLVAQQASDVNQLFESDRPGVKSIKVAHEEFQKSVLEVEESFYALYRDFKLHVENLRKKASDTVHLDKCSQKVKHLQDYLVEKIKHFDSDSSDCNPNAILGTISELCGFSSELQHNYHMLKEKVKTGEFMKHAEDDLHILDAFVSATKQLIPERFQSFEEDMSLDEDDKDFVVVTNSGNFVDFVDEEEELSDIAQHIIFSAKSSAEESCMLSGITLLGNTSTMVVDQVNKKIKKFKLPEGHLLSELSLENEPHQIATLRESDCVGVTLWEVPKILIVSTDPALSVLKVIVTNIEYLGLTSHVVDHLAVSSIQSRRVDVIGVNDTENPNDYKSVTIFQSSRRKSFPDRLTSTHDGRVIVRNRGRNEVCCFGRHELLWSRRLKRKISDITTFRGKVFATLGRKNKIVSFRDDGHGEVEQLKTKMSLLHPWAIDGFKDCLVVTEDSPSDKIHLLVFS